MKNRFLLLAALFFACASAPVFAEVVAGNGFVRVKVDNVSNGNLDAVVWKANVPFLDKMTVDTDATNGAVTYTAANILGGLILRNGGGNQSDILPTAGSIITLLYTHDNVAGVPNIVAGHTFPFTLVNNGSTGVITLTGNTGLTLTGAMTVPVGQGRVFYVRVTSATACTVYGTAGTSLATDLLADGTVAGASSQAQDFGTNGITSLLISAGSAAPIVIQGKAGATNTIGNALTLKGGAGNGTGAGAVGTLAGGAGGATNAAGGNVSATGGASTGTGTGGSATLAGGAVDGVGNAAGGATLVTSANGFGSGAGGALTANSGSGGATGAGGNWAATAGAGGTTSGAAGTMILTAGLGGVGSTTTGAVAQLVAGASGTGATGNGGEADLTGGAALSTAGTGGAVKATGGVGKGTGAGGAVSLLGGATDGASNAAGGAVVLTPANGFGSGAGGALTMVSGSGGTTGAGGNFAFTGGAGGTTSGAASTVIITAGAGGTGSTTTGGVAQLLAGAGSSGGAGGIGGAVTVQGGAAAGTNAAGGNANVTAGAGAGTSNGGQILLTPGAAGGGGSSIPGNISLKGPVSSPVTTAQVVATSGTITLPTSGNVKMITSSAGAITAVVMTVGRYDGETVTLMKSDAGSLTFDTTATSHVADGASAVIATLTRMTLVWDATSAKWYHGN